MGPDLALCFEYWLQSELRRCQVLFGLGTLSKAFTPPLPTKITSHMCYRLNSLKGVGSMIGFTKGDTRRLELGSSPSSAESAGD